MQITCNSSCASGDRFFFNRITLLGQFNWVEKALCKWDFHINKSCHGLNICHLMYLSIYKPPAQNWATSRQHLGVGTQFCLPSQRIWKPWSILNSITFAKTISKSSHILKFQVNTNFGRLLFIHCRGIRDSNPHLPYQEANRWRLKLINQEIT